jgi:hypothetical protein
MLDSLFSDNNLNPKFSKSITLEYYFEAVQNLRFVVWDIDNVKLPIEKQDFIGQLEVTVADLIAHGGTLSRSLVNPKYPKGCGIIHILVRNVVLLVL